MRRPAILLAGLIALATALAIAATPHAQRAEDETLDVRFAARGTQPVDDLAVVAIDERTFGELDVTWPFRRRLHARMLDRLRAAGVRQIVYDVQFTEPSQLPDDDLALYDAVTRARGVVLATGESDAQGRTRVLGGDESLAAAGGAVAANSTFPADAGGVIRRYTREEARLASLGARTAARLGSPVPASAFGADGTALIDFRGPAGTIPTYSFADVLAGKVAAPLRGRTVVVGATAPVLQDVHPTSAPGDRLMPGPEIQANAIWTAVHGNPLRGLPSWAGWLIAGGLGLLGPLAVLLLGPLRGAAAGTVAGAAYAGAAVLAFDAGTVLPVAAPLFALAMALGAAVLAGVAAEIAARVLLSRRNEGLEQAVRERTADLEAAQLEVVRRLARAADLRDDDTGDHIDRMSGLCREVALELGMPGREADLLRHASALHDVGKIGVPDGILRKPGKLDPAEMAVMRHHVAEGAELLSGSDAPLLRMAEEVARTHHERWDGGGYPAGLAGEDIPLVGRIAAVCDVYDALVSERPYKRAWSVEEACAEIHRQRGAHFAPDVADALLAVVARRRGATLRRAA